jgi:hypothetical protein
VKLTIHFSIIQRTRLRTAGLREGRSCLDNVIYVQERRGGGCSARATERGPATFLNRYQLARSDTDGRRNAQYKSKTDRENGKLRERREKANGELRERREKENGKLRERRGKMASYGKEERRQNGELRERREKENGKLREREKENGVI